MIEKLQKTARVFAENRYPLSGDDVARMTGYGYFEACDYCQKLISLGIINVAERSSGGLVQTAVFAPELSGENLNDVVERLYVDDELIKSLKKRVSELEGFLQRIKSDSTKLLENARTN